MFDDLGFCRLRRFYFPFLFFLLSPVLVLASGLPPEHEAVRMELAVKASLESGDYQAADSYLERWAGLEGIVKQPIYSFYRARVLGHAKRWSEAVAALEDFVLKSGREVEEYTYALELITEYEGEEKLVASRVSLEPAGPELEGGDSNYLDSLKSLYLTEDVASALIQQVNSILAAHPYSGERRRGIDQLVMRIYSMSVRGKEVFLHLRSYETGKPQLTIERLDVAGVNPFLSSACSKSEWACWVEHPSDTGRRWITIDQDFAAVDELKRALTRLVRVIQQSEAS